MRRLLFCLLVNVLTIGLMAETSADSTKTDGVEKARQASLYLGAGYGSDLLYSGYSLSGQKPYYSMDVLYSFNRQWSASAAIYHLDGAEPGIAFYDVALGYRRYFNSWWDAGASLSAYFTNPSIQDIYFGHFAYLTLTGGFDWRILYSKLVYSALLDDSGSHYLQMKNSHYFSTNDFWNDKAYMDFNPTFNLVFGDRYKLITTTAGDQVGPGGGAEEVVGYESLFGLMDLEFSIPIASIMAILAWKWSPCITFPSIKIRTILLRRGFSSL